jgi:CHAD domain-containing protein
MDSAGRMASRFNIRVVTRTEGAIARALGLESLDALPHKAGRIKLRRKSTAEEAFGIVVLHCLRHVASNAAAVTLARDPEGVHQIRVGLRRLRAAMTAFGPAFRTSKLESLRRQAKMIASEFGATRELDVFALDLLPDIEDGAEGRPGFVALRFAVEDLRHAAWNESASFAQSDAFTQFVLDLANFVERKQWREDATEEQIAAFEERAKTLARRMLDKRRKNTRKHARHLTSLQGEQRHELRISLKRLRYSSEFFASLFSKSETKPFLRSLSRLQDMFGALNDAATSADLLKRVVEALPDGQATPELREAASFAAGWQSAGTEPVWQVAQSRWKRFKTRDAFWR